MPDRVPLHVGRWIEHPRYLDVVWQCDPACPHPSHATEGQEAA